MKFHRLVFIVSYLFNATTDTAIFFNHKHKIDYTYTLCSCIHLDGTLIERKHKNEQIAGNFISAVERKKNTKQDRRHRRLLIGHC